MQSLSIRNIGGRHVVAANSQAAASLLACANSQDAAAVAFGAGLEISLGRAAGEAAARVAPEWVQLFPKGPAIEARDGRRWTLNQPKGLEAAFAQNGADLPFDVNHAVEIRGPKGEDAPAMGWIKAIEARDDGVWARVDWTDEGAAAVTSRRYRYVSPAFRHTKSGEIIAITSAALVTHPALRLPALARDEGPSTEQEPSPMSTLQARLVAALGLAHDATEDQVVAAATSTHALARDARDPEKLVPAADHQAALARAQAAEATLAERDSADKDAAAATSVDAAIAAGKITPAAREHWISIARETPDAYEKAVAGMPSLTARTDTAKQPDAAADAGDLTPDQKALCAQMGLDEAAFAAQLKDNAQ